MKKGLMLLFLLASFPLQAMKISVEVKNKTLGINQKAEVITLISLEGAMQTVATQRNKSKAIFTYTKELKAPLLVQATYQGVNYNEIIPPVPREQVFATIEVFEKVNKLPSKSELSVLHQFRATDQGQMTITRFYYFNNKSEFTYANKDGGLLFDLPQNLSKLEASVSIGEGKSDFQWLKLQPEQKESSVLLKYPLKPGERIYQVQFEIPLKDNKASLTIKQEFPRSFNDRVVLEPDSMDVTIGEVPNFKVEKKFEETLQANVFMLPDKKNLSLSLESDKLLPAVTREQPDEVTVTIESPYTNTEKVIYPAIAVIAILAFHTYLSSNPPWLQKQRIKEKAQIESELNVIESMSSISPKIEKHREQLKLRLARLKVE